MSPADLPRKWTAALRVPPRMTISVEIHAALQHLRNARAGGGHRPASAAMPVRNVRRARRWGCVQSVDWEMWSKCPGIQGACVATEGER